MPENRSFTSDDIPTKKDDYHGMAKIAKMPVAITTHDIKSLNLEMTFEEALRFSLAIQSCVMQLNRYNRNTTEGKEMGMVLSMKTESSSITVIESRVRT